MSLFTQSTFIKVIYPYVPWISVTLVCILALAYVTHCFYFDMNGCKEAFKDDSSVNCLKKQTVVKYSIGIVDLEKAIRLAIKKFNAFGEKKKQEAKEKYDIDEKQDNSAQSSSKQSTNEKSMGMEFEQYVNDDHGDFNIDANSQSIETFADKTCYDDIEKAKELYTKGPQLLLKAYNELRKQVNTGVDGLLTFEKTQKDIERKEKKRKEESTKANADISKAGKEKKEANAKQYGLNKAQVKDDQTFDKPSVSY